MCRALLVMSLWSERCLSAQNFLLNVRNLNICIISVSLKSMLLYRSLCLYSDYTQCLCEVIQPSNFWVQKVGSANTLFVSVCLEQTLGMTGILLKCFSCCAMLTHIHSSLPVPFSFFLFIALDSCHGESLFFSFWKLCFLCHDLWQLFPRDYTDQVLPLDSILLLESKIRNYYIAIVLLLFLYTIYYTYIQLYIKNGRVLLGL